MEEDTKVFGFWIYLMTDLIIFAVLFAAFAVLRTSTFGGPSARELFHMPFALEETLILLTSSFTCSLATYSVFQGKKNQVMIWFAVTSLLGLSFLYLEMTEFSDLVRQGASWQRSGFLSSYFTLVGAHGLHISVGLLWMIVTLVRIPFRGLTNPEISRMFRLAYFWHFLDVVWIFIFTVVYGIGHLS
jgi:cytochrome o ubiquinol oxidase subunit 3